MGKACVVELEFSKPDTFAPPASLTLKSSLKTTPSFHVPEQAHMRATENQFPP